MKLDYIFPFSQALRVLSAVLAKAMILAIETSIIK